MAVTYYIKIFPSIFDTEIKKASDDGLPENVFSMLLVGCIIVIHLPVKDIIFDCFLQSFVALLALKIYEQLIDICILLTDLHTRLWVF